MLKSINLTKALGFIALAFVITLTFAEPALANNAAMVSIAEKMAQLFNSVRTILFVVGGFGLIGLAMGAIFGNIDWKWVGALAFGLFLVAIASTVIKTFAGEGSISEVEGDMQNTYDY
ncbi:MAG: TrbC/VirB2 family protein [Alphaproteobacteria bacterium]|nr:TrbC/VirB2 family protein [Alphaproteobacteria bacterium]